MSWSEKLFFYCFCIALITTTACKFKNREVKIPPPTIKNCKIEPVHIKRYEQALFSLDTNNIKAGLPNLLPEFYAFLGDQWQLPENIKRLRNFIADRHIRELYHLSVKQFPDLSKQEKELTKALGLYRSYFPQVSTPIVYSYVSGLDVERTAFFVKDGIAIALDLFLGKDAAVYEKSGLPKYKREEFNPNHITPKTIIAIADTHVSADENAPTLLNKMITEGKKLYFLDAIIPDTPDNLKIGYTKEKYEWCKENESQIWAFIIESQALFSTDFIKINRLINDAPFTSGLSNESPGRIGAYVGWQIVRAYMNKNQTTLPELMNTAAQEILDKSNYKPKK